MKRFVVSILWMVVGAVYGQLPIPTTPPGFTYGHGKASAGVQLETYIDLLCPDSQSAFTGLKKLANHYKPDEFRLRFVLFPLPYHQYAFAAAESTYTVTAALGEDAFEPWLETLYNNQDKFWNKPTQNLTAIQVTSMYYDLATKTFPHLTEKQWEAGMSGHGGTFADNMARIAWKYTCARGKSGTPMYSLNGVPYGDADSTWSFEDWRKVIDPLVQANQPPSSSVFVAQNAIKSFSGVLTKLPDRPVVHFSEVQNLNKVAQVCEGVTNGHRPCEFLPGRAMCCERHEVCILRKGCMAL